MVQVIGSFSTGTGAGGEGVSVPIIGIDGDWPLGTSPGTITVEIPGSFIFGSGGGGGGAVITGVPTFGGVEIDVGALETFCSPERARSVKLGDALANVVMDYLYVSVADPSELRVAKGVVHVTLHDRRIWWARRAAIGARAYNVEQNGERVSTGQVITPSWVGNNPRMHASTIRTGNQILLEIMASCGENPGNIKLTGQDGFADLSAPSAPGAVPLLEDYPPWVQDDGEKPLSCLERFCSYYSIRVALSLNGEIGFVYEKDIAKKLASVMRYAITFQTRATPALLKASVGFDRESLPDVLYIHGAPILIGDYLTLEPVCRDPDVPERFIPLFRTDTLEAYGVDISLPGRQDIKHGATCYGLAMALATAEDVAPEVPPRLHSMVREWGRFWRVAQPLETVNAPADAGISESVVDPASTRSARKVEETDPATGLVYTRVKSPRYRLKRGNPSAGGTLMEISGRSYWEPDGANTVSEMHRWLPLAPHTEQRASDGAYSAPRVLGCNLLKAIRVKTLQGQDGLRWVEIGKRIDNPTNYPTFPDQSDGRMQPGADETTNLVDIGNSISIVDPDTGVIDVGEQLIGTDGTSKLPDMLKAIPGLTPAALWHAFVQCRTGPAEAPEAEPQPVETPVEGSTPIGSFGTSTAPTSGEEEEEEEPRECKMPPLGLPYLVLHCATSKKCHGDERDKTSTHSTIPPHGLSDPFGAAPNCMEELRVDLYSAVNVGEIEPAPIRGRPLEIWDHFVTDLELRCQTVRLVDPNAIHSFLRSTGRDGGSLDGSCFFADSAIVKRDSVSQGTCCPIGRDHYKNVFNFMRDAIKRYNAGIKEYRETTNGIKTVTAEIGGCPRGAFPGVTEWGDHPISSVAFRGSGDSSSFVTTISANCRGLREWIGSMLDKYNEEVGRQRSTGSVGSGIMRQ